MAKRKKPSSASSDTETYWQAVRRPIYALIFLLPMMVAYETGVVMWGREAAEEALRNTNRPYAGEVMRNGADALIRRMLGHLGTEFGRGALFVSGGVIIITLIGWQIASRQKWSLRFDNVVGMFSESVLYATVLPLFYLISTLQPFRATMSPAVEHCMNLSFDFGSGVYEEFIFRLVLVSCLAIVMRWAFMADMGVAKFISALVAAVIFAGAHHLGNMGEPFAWNTFIMRSIVGLFFGAIFVARGFGVAAGTHVFYNVILRVLIMSGTV